MYINNKEIREWIDFIDFRDGKAYLNTEYIDAYMCPESADFADGDYMSLIAGEPGNQYLNIEKMNAIAAASAERAKRQYSLAKNAKSDFIDKLYKMETPPADNSFPYERRVIGIRKMPTIYRTEKGGLSAGILARTMFGYEQAKYIFGWREKNEIQTVEVTPGKSGDFFDHGKSRVVGSTTEITRHGGIYEDDEFYYLHINSEADRAMVINELRNEYGILLDPPSCIYEGYKIEESFFVHSLAYSVSNGRPMPSNMLYPIDITPARAKQLLSGRAGSELAEDKRKSRFSLIQLILSIVLMFPFTLLVHVSGIAGILADKVSWLANYLVSLLPGLFHGKIWPLSDLTGYGTEMLKSASEEDIWLTAFWIAVPVCLAFASSFSVWKDGVNGAGDVVAYIFKQILMFAGHILAYPLAAPVFLGYNSYVIARCILKSYFAKRDISQRKQFLANQANTRKIQG